MHLVRLLLPVFVLIWSEDSLFYSYFDLCRKYLSFLFAELHNWAEYTATNCTIELTNELVSVWKGTIKVLWQQMVKGTEENH